MSFDGCARHFINDDNDDDPYRHKHTHAHTRIHKRIVHNVDDHCHPSQCVSAEHRFYRTRVHCV